MVITFSLPIFPDIKDGLKLVYLVKNIPDDGLLSELEFDSTISLSISIYGNYKVQLMLDFIDKDALAKMV